VLGGGSMDLDVRPFEVDLARIKAADAQSGPLSSASLIAELEALARGFPDRQYGTEQGRRAAEHLAARMEQIGLRPLVGEGDARTHLQTFEGKEKVGRNVIGLLPGTHPVLKDEVVIVSFHYDSQKATKEGANDNASGGAIVLAIAKMLAKKPPKRSVMFVAFDGEEVGKLGSNHYVKNPPIALDKTALLVNIDEAAQVHLESGPRSEVYQWSSRDTFATNMLRRASKKALKPGDVAVQGYPEQTYEAQFFTTDALPFFRRGIPIVNLLSGRDIENHGPNDSMERVIPERLVQYAKLAHAAVVEGANHPDPIARALGRSPDVFLPAFPLLDLKRARDVSTGRSVRSESRYEIEAKLPRFRRLASKLVEAVEGEEILQRAGLSKPEVAGEGPFLSEETLHRIRSAHRAAVDALHDIPKDDLEARRASADRTAAIAGIEGVLTGALYLVRLRSANRYQLQRVPEKLADLVQGARSLGLGAMLEEDVSDTDTAPFSTIVTPTRALEIARDSLDEFPAALQKSLYALMNPDQAREFPPRLDSQDIARIRDRAVALEKEHGNKADEVVEANALLAAGEAALRIEAFFDGTALRKTTSLGDLVKEIDVVRAVADMIVGGDEIARELAFWSSWIRTFEPVDALVAKQKEERANALAGCREALMKLWAGAGLNLSPLKPDERATPKAALEAISRQIEPRFPSFFSMAFGSPEPTEAPKIALKRRIEPFAKVESEIKYVESGLSSNDLRRAIEALSSELSDEAVADLSGRFAAFSALEDKQGVELCEAKGCALYEVRAMNKELPKESKSSARFSSSSDYGDSWY
jgi:hypothetical protein